MFVSSALAQTAPAAATSPGSGIEAFLPLILIFVVFYFLLIRPQQKKMKEHKEMLAALRRGDKVVTGGGIIGTISKVVSDDEVVVEIAEGVRVRVQRAQIAGTLARTEPVKDAGKKDSGKDDAGDAAAEKASGNETPPSTDTGSALKALLGGKKKS